MGGDMHDVVSNTLWRLPGSTVHEHEALGSRDLGLMHARIDYSVLFDTTQQQVVRWIAVVCATISIITALLTTYWFVRMKKNYRHYLIMKLIQCNLLRTVWFLVYPVVFMTRGFVLSDSTFCQASGFFLAFGTEAVDIANLMLAVHTAIHIFAPRHGPGEGGLYPFRYVMYAFWFGFSVLFSSLAFVNPDTAFVSTGLICYLPVRPFWYRLALAWIPRYIILIAIIGLTFAIYTYVVVKFGSIRREMGHTYDIDLTESESDGSVATKMPPITLSLAEVALSERREKPVEIHQLACHGLISEGGNQDGTTSAVPDPLQWQDPFVIRPVQRDMSLDAISFGAAVMSLDAARQDSLVREDQRQSRENSKSVCSTNTTPFGRQSSDCGSRIGILHALTNDRPTVAFADATIFDQRRSSALRSPHTSYGGPEMPISPMMIGNKFPQPITTTDNFGKTAMQRSLFRTHQQIRRELRMLFIYPAIYLLSWIFPFVTHCFQYSEYYSRHPPFALTCLATLTVSLQCAVDCFIFSIREKPWQHIPNTPKTFWSSFQFWKYPGSGRPWSDSAGAKRASGMTDQTADTASYYGQDSTAESKFAYERRDAELAQAASYRERGSSAHGSYPSPDASSNHRLSRISRTTGEKADERFWWDEEARRSRDSSPFPSGKLETALIPSGDDNAAIDDIDDDEDDDDGPYANDEEAARGGRRTTGRKREMKEKITGRQRWSVRKEEFQTVPLTLSPRMSLSKGVIPPIPTEAAGAAPPKTTSAVRALLPALPSSIEDTEVPVKRKEKESLSKD